ncbi:MAG TPA: hypothetical protein VK177_21110 [Flavobacteriales bacterium]|nr:hypothetical protein [Flavobacteriales bacterium]
MQRYLLILVFFISASSGFCANDNFTIGARQLGMGGCGLTLRDVWGTQHNQANLAWINQYSAGIYYENKFGLKETSLKNISGAIPVGKIGAFGVCATQFGFTNYNQSKYGLGYGMRVAEGFSMGLQLNYNALRLGDIYGSKKAFTAEFGINAKLIEKLTFGAHIYNVSRTMLTKTPVNEFIPTVVRLGLQYNFSEAVSALAETESTINYSTNVKIGIEYRMKNKFFMRAGINTKPFQAAFGIGYHYKLMYVDIAACYHQVLGFTPALSLHCNFGEKSTVNEVPK